MTQIVCPLKAALVSSCDYTLRATWPPGRPHPWWRQSSQRPALGGPARDTGGDQGADGLVCLKLLWAKNVSVPSSSRCRGPGTRPTLPPALIAGGLNLRPQAQPSKLGPSVLWGVRDPLWQPKPTLPGACPGKWALPWWEHGPRGRRVTVRETVPEPPFMIFWGPLCSLGTTGGWEGGLHRCAPPTSQARQKGEGQA